MTESLDFQEIFGASTVRESLGQTAPPMLRTLPQLPMETLEWELRNAPDGAADRLVKRVELTELLDGICGEYERPAMPAPMPAPAVSLDFVKDFVGDALQKHNHPSDLEKQAPRRRRELRAIFQKFVSKLRPPTDEIYQQDNDWWAAEATESALKMLHQSILEAT